MRKIALTLPSLPLSGVGTSVAIIQKGLINAGFAVEMIITGHDPGNDVQYAQDKNISIKLPCVHERYLPRRLRLLAECLNSNGYDIILNNTSAETQLVLPCINPEILRVAVMRVLNPSALRHLAMNSNYLHAAVGISEEMTRSMAADSRIQPPVKLIPNCTLSRAETLPALSSRVKICYVGRLSIPDKNVLVLPDVVKMLICHGVSFSMDIVGDGPARKQLEGGFGGSFRSGVTFHGPLSREETQAIMVRSNFVLLPSVSEGLSNVMLDGMALGCVPVCSDIDNFKWVLGDAASQLQCRLHDPEDYARRIVFLARRPETYHEMQQYLRNRQQELFTPEKTTQGYINLIEGLSSGNARVLPPPVAFEKMRIPLEYRMYCTPAWRLAQKAKEIVGGRKRGA